MSDITIEDKPLFAEGVIDGGDTIEFPEHRVKITNNGKKRIYFKLDSQSTKQERVK